MIATLNISPEHISGSVLRIPAFGDNILVFKSIETWEGFGSVKPLNFFIVNVGKRTCTGRHFVDKRTKCK
jgi:hypothetical protein